MSDYTHQYYNEEHIESSNRNYPKNDTIENIRNDFHIVNDCKPHLDTKTYVKIINHLQQRTEYINKSWKEVSSEDYTPSETKEVEEN